MSEEEEFERKPRPWIIAIVAVVTVIAASLLAFRAFNARANAEVEAHPQSAQSEAHQSIGSQSDDAQSGETRRCQWVVAMSSLNASVGVR